MPKGFSEHEKEFIRERLLRAGDRQFSAYGLKKTSVESLAAAAQISKGAFYRFYESKEALFMDVAEQAEQRLRQQIFAAIEQPGPSPRARLYRGLRTAFDQLKSTPLLQRLTGSDYDLLVRRVPPEKVQQHLASDQLFIEDLVARCQAAGIPIRVAPPLIGRLLYPLVLAHMRAGDLGQAGAGEAVYPLLELVAAYCLGEVALSAAGLAAAESRPA
jgi:AcrR family transcriptional regulator